VGQGDGQQVIPVFSFGKNSLGYANAVLPADIKFGNLSDLPYAQNFNASQGFIQGYPALAIGFQNLPLAFVFHAGKIEL